VSEPPLDDWSRAEVLREVLRVARGLDGEDFERDVLPRLRQAVEGLATAWPMRVKPRDPA